MSTLERLASELAEDTMAAMTETGNDRLFVEVAQVISASSQSLEEVYLTEIRVRMTERTARNFLNQKLAEARAAKGSGG